MEKLLLPEDSKILSNPELFYSYTNFNFKITKKDSIEFNYSKIIDLEFYIRYQPIFKKYKNPNYYFLKEVETFNLKFYISEPSPNEKLKGTFLILIHGFQSTNKKIYKQLAERFCKRGITSLIYTLPFHFERLPENLDYNKTLDLSDFMNILEFYRQSIIELRIIINFIKDMGYKKIGCMGFSIGGHYCNILSCFEKNMDFSISMASTGSLIPISKLPQNTKKSNPISSNNQNGPRSNLNIHLIENYYPLVNPICFKPKIDKHNILLIQGLFDHRAPIKEVQRFRKAWDYPPTVWLPCDHFTFFLFNRLTVKLVTNFLQKIYT